jgi:sterol desaturase/sphingolipid hydroxylase (fatty acid hydroxylase superfamily)
VAPRPAEVDFPEGDAREKKRSELLAGISRRYSPALHLLATIGSGVAILVVGIVAMDDVQPLEWLVIPVMFLLANSAEWRAHRGLLHERTPPAHILYDRHTPQHHVIFRYDDMAIRQLARLMKRWNFNVTIPLWDWVCGTTAPRELVDEITQKR